MVHRQVSHLGMNWPAPYHWGILRACLVRKNTADFPGADKVYKYFPYPIMSLSPHAILAIVRPPSAPYTTIGDF